MVCFHGGSRGQEILQEVIYNLLIMKLNFFHHLFVTKTVQYCSSLDSTKGYFFVSL